MHVLHPTEPAAPAPPAALLSRFDQLLPRNLALPPVEAFVHPLSAGDLMEALECNRGPAGLARSMSLHLLVRLPCDASPDGGRALAALVRELRGLADALDEPQDIARITVQACDGMTMGDRRLGCVLDSVGARFRTSSTEVCVEVQRVDLPTLHDWRSAGASRVMLTAPSSDALGVARASELVAVTVAVDRARRGLAAGGLAASLGSLARAGVARVDLGPGDRIATAVPACGDASRPVSPDARRAAARAAAVDTLLGAGFQHVACGLFARSDDPLLSAARRARLHLEVDGLAATAAAGTLAVGPGMFGRMGATFYRNARGPAAYLEAVERCRLSIASGAVLSREALAARAAVVSLVCSGWVDFEAIALSHLIEPRQAFVRALRDLVPLARAGLVDIDPDGVALTPRGRQFVQVVAAAFEPRGA
jgi:oxygen-independent coproporphyrinogen-3 oxidase